MPGGPEGLRFLLPALCFELNLYQWIMKMVSERKKPVKCGEGGVFEAVLCQLILLAVQNEDSILKTATLPFSSCCTSHFQLC